MSDFTLGKLENVDEEFDPYALVSKVKTKIEL